MLKKRDKLNNNNSKKPGNINIEYEYKIMINKVNSERRELNIRSYFVGVGQQNINIINSEINNSNINSIESIVTKVFT